MFMLVCSLNQELVQIARNDRLQVSTKHIQFILGGDAFRLRRESSAILREWDRKKSTLDHQQDGTFQHQAHVLPHGDMVAHP